MIVMYDLIYTENRNDYDKIWEIIKKEYPEAVLEDGSDQIHENRFSVDLVEFEMEHESWFSFIIKNGFAMLSLNFQLMIKEDPDKTKKLVDKVLACKINVVRCSRCGYAIGCCICDKGRRR